MNTSTAPPFVHLHNYSDYSLLSSALQVDALVRTAAELEMGAVALTDRGNLFGAIEFYLGCRKASLKSILGMEVQVARDHRESGAEAGPSHALVLLAQDSRGWSNLIRLASLGYRDGLADGPRVDKELLAAHSQGLIALSGGLDGELAGALVADDGDWARRVIGEYHEIYGTDGFFVEIQDHGVPAQARVRSVAPDLARQTGARLVVTNGCAYASRAHAHAYDVLTAVAAGRTVDDPTRQRVRTDQAYVKSPAEMVATFPDMPDALANTVEIAGRCDVELTLGRLLLPEFPLPAPFEQPDAYLEKLSRDGAIERYGAIDDRVEARLRHELAVIQKMGFAGYFLITGDFVRAARERRIPVGPGRGSAAGSLICYSLGITDVDPLHHDLLFERFLNPERISMPDIDIDFCFERRGEIIEYVVDKYGAESVCQIITFGKLLARGVLRDVGRALGLSYGETDRIAKLVPDTLGITLEAALEQVEELRAVRQDDPRYDQLIHTALDLEGMHRHASIHAAGILITPGDLIEHVPLYKSSKQEITTQWDMKMVEEVGLLKMDFLGLRTLTVIDKALAMLPETGGPEMDPGDIPLDDPGIYGLAGKGETVGVFQLESSGMQEVLRKLKPSSFEDITAVNALYRPGPLGSGMVDDFIDRKHGRKPIEYLHPELEPILKETYGVILYQEQVMRIAGELAGFTMGEADTLRKAMGKKIEAVMKKMAERFLEGATARGIDAEIARQIFDLMAFFAGYGFNKSHSVSYAVLSAQTAWLKAHHPAAFIAAALTSEMTNSDRVQVLVDEARRLDIQIMNPDVNTCTADFRVVDGAVRFGLGAVKNVGLGAIEAIVEARAAFGQPFRDLYEFCDEIDLTRVNRRVLESLNLAGAMDTFPGTREQRVAALDLALARAQRKARDKARGQGGLFVEMEEAEGTGGVLPQVAPWTPRERLSKERALIGFYLTGHPLDEYRGVVAQLKPTGSRDLSTLPEDKPVMLCGVVSALKTVTTRRTGSILAFVTLEDFQGNTEIVFFSEAYEQNRQRLAGDSILLVSGRTSVREGEPTKLVAEKVHTLEEACPILVNEIHVELPADLDTATSDRLLELVAGHPGERALMLHLHEGEFEACVRASRAAVVPATELLLGLMDLFGPGGVRLACKGVGALHPELMKPRQGAWRRRAESAS